MGKSTVAFSVADPGFDIKFSEIRSGMYLSSRIDPVSALDFFPSRISDPDPGSRVQKSTESRIRIRNTG